MGTKVQSLPGYYAIRDLNEESSSCGWPLFYGDKALANGQYYQNYLLIAAADVCSAYDKDVVKQMMLEHEAIFKNQVFELHRLYRIQRDLMDEIKMKELQCHISVGTSFSSGPLLSQITYEDGKKWHIHGFPVIGSSTCDRPSISSVEAIHSPLGLNKGFSKQACLFPSPNGSSSKDVDVLESRPSKVRRKMFDLHLPADEYIDTEESEKFNHDNIGGSTKFLPEINCKHRNGDAEKLFCCNAGKISSQEHTSRSEKSLRSSNGLADLNEPVQVEETKDIEYVPPPHHNPYEGATECSNLSNEQKSRLFGLSREDLLNSHHGTNGWAQSNGYLESRGKVWISSMETGQPKSSGKPIPQVLKQEQSLLSSQTMHHEHSSDYLNTRCKTDLWREQTVSGIDVGERNNEYSPDKHPEPVISSHRPGVLAIASSSDLAKAWSHSSCEIVRSLNHKLTSVQTAPFQLSGAMSMSSQSHQTQSQQSTGKNGFYPGISYGSKELSGNFSSVSYDYLNHNNDCKKITEQFNNGSINFYMSSNSNCNDIKSEKDIDLNVLFINGSSNNLVTQSGLGIIDGEQKHEEQLAALPWLRVKTTCKNEAQNGRGSLTAGELSFSKVASSSNIDETGKGSSEKIMQNISGLCSNDIEQRRTKASESCSKKKFLGVPIFDMPQISPKGSSSRTSPSVPVSCPSDIESVENNWKNQVLDINMPCDADVLDLDKQAGTETMFCKKGSSIKETNSRNQIDLNLSMSEDEAFLTAVRTTSVEMQAEIDLEAPAVPETEEDAVSEEKQLETTLESPLGPQDTVEQMQDESMRHAAEAIVVLSFLCCNQVDNVISSPSERPMADPLSWFVDVVSSCTDDLPRKFDNSRGNGGEDNGEMDFFESMTLKLTETKIEDYMPKPLVPEDFNVQEIGTLLPTTQARKGPARRERQRRDFQRDILPGLTSLSRHDVREDLQTFGGLMKATGHAWNSGLTRRGSSRNGYGRGRRLSQVVPSPPAPVVTTEICTPLKQKLNNIELGLEDRSLTGWGKTTRRPRRHRCPAGNPPSFRLI